MIILSSWGLTAFCILQYFISSSLFPTVSLCLFVSISLQIIQFELLYFLGALFPIIILSWNVSISLNIIWEHIYFKIEEANPDMEDEEGRVQRGKMILPVNRKAETKIQWGRDINVH